MIACEQALCGTLAGGWEKEGELATTTLEFEYLHRKSRCEMLIGRDDISCVIIELGWRNISFLLQKDPPFEYAPYMTLRTCTFFWIFKTYLQIQTLILIGSSLQPLSDKFVHFTSKIRSLEFRNFVQTARKITCTLQNQREVIFDLPYPRDRTASNNSPPPEPNGWTCPGGCPGEDGNRSNWTIHLHQDDPNISG